MNTYSSDDINRERNQFITSMILKARENGQQLNYIRRIHEEDLPIEHRNGLNRLNRRVGDEIAIEFHEFEIETEDYIVPMIIQYRIRPKNDIAPQCTEFHLSEWLPDEYKHTGNDERKSKGRKSRARKRKGRLSIA